MLLALTDFLDNILILENWLLYKYLTFLIFRKKHLNIYNVDNIKAEK
jgi:hypothetical protein